MGRRDEVNLDPGFIKNGREDFRVGNRVTLARANSGRIARYRTDGNIKYRSKKAADNPMEKPYSQFSVLWPKIYSSILT
ncbi:hypothetical protein [Kordiimonas sp.]|uniref:hypothetical protein n=1 Tax=Kordiimonas sp. TaxID=1970157 RepID=UPI003A8EC549